MISRSEVRLRHAVYYLSKLKDIKKRLSEEKDITAIAAEWKLEQENINLGQTASLELHTDETHGENLWFDYGVAGSSFLRNFNPFQEITWIESCLSLSIQKADLSKQLLLLEYLAFTHQAIGQPVRAGHLLRDGLRLARMEGNDEKACHMLNKLGDMYGAINKRAVVFDRLPAFDFAIHFYRKALELARENDLKKEITYALYQLADIYFRCGYFQHSEIYSKRALLQLTTQEEDKRIRCLYLLARTYLLNGKRTLAISTLKSASDLLSAQKTAKSEIDLAIFSTPILLEGNIQSYQEILSNLIKSYGTVPAYRMRLLATQAASQLAYGRRKDALSAFEDVYLLAKELNNIEEELNALFHIARIHLLNGDRTNARITMRQATELSVKNDYPIDSPLWEAMEMLLKWPTFLGPMLSLIDSSVYSLRKFIIIVLRLRSNYLEWRLRNRRVAEADLYVHLGYLGAQIQKHPKIVKYRLQLVSVYIIMREFDVALEELDKIMSIFSNNPNAYYMKAEVLENLEDYPGALEYYTKALSFRPKNTIFLIDRGLFFFHQDKFEEALVDIEAAIRIKPKQGLYYAHRGMVLSRLGRQVEAEKDFDKAFELKAGAYGYICRAAIAGRDLEVENAISNLRLAFSLNPVAALRAIKFDPCLEKIKTIPMFREFMAEIQD